MSSTTTIRLAEKSEHEERRSAFESEAQARLSRLVQSGWSIAWADMKRYFEARIAGEKAAPPAVRELAP